MKVRWVMAARLEARRSIPELDEGGRKPAGGLKTFWRANRCCDLGIGVKNQSSLALASSNRSVSQGVLCGDSVSGRALIGGRGEEIPHPPFKLRTDTHRRSKDTGSCGVRLTTERGLTQTEVKVPKFLLSVKPKSVFPPRQQGGMLRSSNPLKSV